MEKLKGYFAAPTNFVRNASIGLAGVAAASPVFAEVDITGVKAGIESAQGKGEEVGGYVIIAAVALVVVGVVLAIVKKI